LTNPKQDRATTQDGILARIEDLKRHEEEQEEWNNGCVNHVGVLRSSCLLMSANEYMRSAVQYLATAAGLAVLSYGAYAGITWYRYGRVRHTSDSEAPDPLLDRFIPEYEAVERHQVRVAAPAEVTLSIASEMDLGQSAIIRGIFKGRELILGSEPGEARSQGLLVQTKALGWGVLAEIPGREIVMGAVTQPWMANVVFQAVPGPEFAAFDAPGYVKIVWTLRADPIGTTESLFRTETRVATTDPTARKRFRRYWSFVSPGIWLIRWASLGLVRKEAARRARHDTRGEPA